MKLFDGLRSTDYQDILRAVGFLIDREGMYNLRLVETEDGLLLQAMRRCQSDQHPHLETFEMGEEEIRQMLQEAYARRNPTAPLPERGPSLP